MHIIFTSQARDDVDEAFSWYEEREVGLGNDFVRRLEAILSLVQRHPDACPIISPPFRRAFLRRFPFELIYEATRDSIFVIAVFHCAQRPE